jgi:Family of unknown function (DUF5706)
MSTLHPFEDIAAPAAADHGVSGAAPLSSYFALVGQVEDQVRFADSKAAFLATIHTLLVGPIVYNVVLIRSAIHTWDDASRAVLLGLGGSYALTFLAGMGFLALAVLPRFKRRGRPASQLFFGRIAREFGEEPDRFVARLAEMSDREWVDELGVYVVDASRIAAAKHRYVRRATLLTVASVVAWCAVVVALVLLH